MILRFLKIRLSVLLLSFSMLFSPAAPAATPADLTAAIPLVQVSVTDQNDAVKDAYPKLFAQASFGPVIPGLAQGFVPQGLGYSSALKAYLISGYFSEGDLPPVLAVVCAVSGKIRKTLVFGDEAGEAQTGHFGGVAAHGPYIYAVSGKNLFVYDAEAVLSQDDGAVLPALRKTELGLQGSFCAAGGGALWVGTFVNPSPAEPADGEEPQQPAEEMQGEMVGYRFSASGELGLADPDAPEYTAAIPALVQGVAFCAPQTFVFSCSYGRTRNAKLLFFRDGKALLNDKSASFSKESASHTLTLPPMSEGLTVSPKGLVILFESGAACYRENGGKAPLDRMVTISWPALYRYDLKK